MGAIGVSFDNPNYLGGEHPGEGYAPEGLTGYYRQQGSQIGGLRPQQDPYMQQWGQQATANQAADRERLQQLYAQLQAQAAGGMTPQQKQQQDAFLMARQNQQQAATSQGGNPYARAAANAALSQGGGVQGMQQVQQAGQLRAADMMAAQQQMQQVAAAQRAMDLQNQGLTAEQAQRQAELEAKARGMGYQQQLGYAGLELGANQQNLQSYVDSIRRGYQAANQKQQQDNAQMAAGMSMAGSALGAGLGMIPRG